MAVGSRKQGSGTTGAPAAAFTAISPITDYSAGGENFVVTGDGLDPREWDDYFTGTILDVVKWLDISAGTGTVTTGTNHLQLSTGAGAGGVGGVESVSTFTHTQGEILALLPNLTTFPPVEVQLINLTLYVDVNNYCSLYVTFDVDGAYLLNWLVYRNGATVSSDSTTWTHGTSVLKILRWNSKVYFIANGAIVFISENFYTNAAKFRIFSDNLADAYTAYSTVEWFYFRPFAVFEDRPIHDTKIISDTRIRGVVPYSVDDKGVAEAYAGDVDISVVGRGSDTSVNAFEYTYKDKLKLINSTAKGIDFQLIDDDQLITPDNVKRGLGV